MKFKFFPQTIFLFFLLGCSLLTQSESGEIPENFRIITGELLVPREVDFGSSQNQGMTVAALLSDETQEISLLVGETFDPSQSGASGGSLVRFRFLAPADRSLALFFQTPPSSGSGDFFGTFLARIVFAADANNTSLSSILPAGDDQIILDFGRVEILSFDTSTNTDNLAVLEENPLEQIDTDNDGISDGQDFDDDADGIPDPEDDDDDNDGVPEVFLEEALDQVAGVER